MGFLFGGGKKDSGPKIIQQVQPSPKPTKKTSGGFFGAPQSTLTSSNSARGSFLS